MGKPLLAEVLVPMPDDAMVDTAHQHLDKMRLIAINNDKDYEYATDALKDIKARHSRIDAMRKALKAPIDAAGKRVQEFFMKPLRFLEEAEGIVKARMSEYLTKREGEQRRLQQQANAEAARERAKLESRAIKAEESGNFEKAEALTERAVSVIAPMVAAPPPKVAGTSVREAWDFAIEDAVQIPREFMMPDEKKIRAYVRAMRSEARIPGVRIWSEKQIAASGRTL